MIERATGGNMKHHNYAKRVTAALAMIFLLGCSYSSDSGSGLSSETLSNVAHVLWLDSYDPSEIPVEIQQRLNDQINSPEAFGERMLTLFEDLITDPDSCTPNYTPRYETFEEFTATMSPHEAYATTILLGPTSSRGYKEVPTSMEFSFPADDRPNFEYKEGWHFFVGSAFTASGEEYGVELMFWQYTLIPTAMAEAAGLSELDNQMLELHLAISKAGDKHYRTVPYVVAGTTGLISFSSSPFNYVLGNNYIRSKNADTLFPLQLRAWGLDESGTSPVELEIDITLTQTKGYVLEGDRGLSPSCGGIGTLYYSVPNLLIDPSTSTLTLNGRKVELSSGKFWYDHQYGTGFLPSGNPRPAALRAFTNLETPNPGGWDWMMVQFDDDTEFGLSALHTTANEGFYEQTGANPPGTMTAAASGLYIDQDGGSESVTGHIEVSEWIKSTVSYSPYLATDAWYPNKVKVVLESDVVPEDKREFFLIPIVQTGQQGFFSYGAQYSEGAVYVETTDGVRVGRGFLEATGYADLRRQALVLAGMPTTDSMIELLDRQVFTDEQKAACEAFLLEPENAAKLVEELEECKGI